MINVKTICILQVQSVITVIFINAKVEQGSQPISINLSDKDLFSLLVCVTCVLE